MNAPPANDQALEPEHTRPGPEDEILTSLSGDPSSAESSSPPEAEEPTHPATDNPSDQPPSKPRGQVAFFNRQFPPVATREPQFREEVAKGIADEVVKTFKFAVLGGLGAGFVVIMVAGLYWWSPTAAATLAKDAVVPFVTAIATFTSTVFGPLLAFILGYYFGEKKGQ